MSKRSLTEHYDRKYSHESTTCVILPIRSVQIPTSRFEAIVRYFPEYFNGGAILEIAAGSGNVAKALLASDKRITNYTLGDISLPRVDGLRRNLQDSRISIVAMDAENISELTYIKYDAIIMLAIIEHLIDPMSAMQEIRKLLRPGGFVYIDTPNIARYTQRLKLLLGRFPSTASANEGLTTFSGEPSDLYDEGHLHYFTFRSLSLMLTDRCGFSRVVKLCYPGGRVPLGKHVHNYLAKIWPELFSELAIIAHA